MKTHILSLAILAIAVTGSVQAQVQMKPTQDPGVSQQRSDARAVAIEDHGDHMSKELGLSDDQAAKMKELDGRYAQKREEIRANTKDSQQLQTHDDALRARQDEELRSILTPEQLTKLQEMRKAERPQGVERSTE